MSIAMDSITITKPVVNSYLQNDCMLVRKSGYTTSVMEGKKSMDALNFAAWLQKWAGDKNLNQSAVAKLARLPRQTISQLWNAGAVPNPDTCRAIAKALGKDEGEALRAAGHYKAYKSKYTEEINEIAIMFDELPQEARLQVLDIVRAIYDRQTQKR